MYNKNKTTLFIKEKAIKYGFDACGISLPAILNYESSYLKKWLKNRKHGNIKYLENNIEEKTDLFKIFKNTKSVIALIKSYYCTEKQTEHAFYKIAKYAYVNDYHIILKNKTNEYIKELKTEIKNAELKIFIDSNYVLEKTWAARCGLGWIGKNTLLVNENFGSFVFIVIILTDIELEYDEVYNKNCGNCNLCVEACPVGAIEQPYNLNASKCISYLTIEDKNITKQKAKDLTQGWIYGCDICQNICPYNKNILPTNNSQFIPNKHILQMTRKEWENLDETTFNNIFKDSAIKRIGFGKIKKNIEIA